MTSLRLISFLAFPLALGTIVKDLSCHQGNVRRFEIQNCTSAPCTIKKGDRVPFELEVSFTHPPAGPAELHFSAFNPYYAVPPNAYGEDVAQGDCRGGLGFQCPPLQAGKGYTIKSELYVDPKATCSSGDCDDTQNQLVTTIWLWNAYVRGDTQSGNSGFCQFKVDLLLVPQISYK